ncbi:MAG: fused MFS/spermidine synthase [Actinobacteria bacterium]|nr:fused MFS/spermidine synthase [Actinomycetota bacterium]
MRDSTSEAGRVAHAPLAVPPRSGLPPSPPAQAASGAFAVGLAVFTGGAVLLGVEIAASRVLAPFFGNSLFVWGALIGVVLAGLAAGYWLGGALADRLPALGLLLSVLAGAALLVLAIPYADDVVLEAVVGWNPGPRLNPLLAAVILFAGPSVLLAAVSPIAVRLRTRSVASAGRTAGRLFALSTTGSIAGTFATAFWLIPEFGTDQLLALGAAALLGAVALVSVSERMVPAFALSLAATIGVGIAAVSLAPEAGGTLSGAAARNWSPAYGRQDKREAGAVDFSGYRVVHTADTRYHRLAVVDDEKTRYLRFDASYQSAMYLGDPYRTRYRYTDFFQLGFAYNPGARNILFIGLGGGSAPKRVWRDFPGVSVQVVELDPAVVDAGYRYFDVPRHRRLRVDVEDGRRYLADNARRWDVVAIDAFYADSVPFHLTTRQFLELVKARLAPGGVVVTNAIGAITGDGSKLFRSMYRTYRSTFPTVLVHPVKLAGESTSASEYRNLMMVATERPAPNSAFLAQRWHGIKERSRGAPDLSKPILDRYDRTIPVNDVPTLTDDYAPTDALLFLGQ